MKKTILLIVGILLAGGSAFWAYQVKTDLQKNIEEKISLNEENDRRRKVEIDTEQKRKDMEDARDLAIDAQIKSGAELQEATETNSTLTADLAQVDADLKKAKEELDALIGDADQRNPDEMLAKVDALKASIKEKEDRRVELATLIETTNGKLQPLELDHAKLQERLTKYDTGVAKNSVEYSITAVDPKWGFVIVNAGESAGLDPNVPLLVTRNGKRQAVLNITQIEKNQTVADIVPTSLKPGNTLQVGDKIIPLKPQG